MTPAPHPHPLALSRREREIMEVLYALGRPAPVEDIRSHLIKPPSYSAARAMLAKLEAKGYVRHREEGLRYVYEPTTSRSAAQRNALQRLVAVFFGGSAGDTVAALLKQEKWSSSELDALEDAIEHVRKERKRR